MRYDSDPWRILVSNAVAEEAADLYRRKSGDSEVASEKDQAPTRHPSRAMESGGWSCWVSR
jgi:hypothetical protein